ncbi:hypothetical protein EV359DRAFT_66900 [Lentinula novae-zelandiae]|nr:hypothetical protein EV359DRAFT_66900 [Lentinula novae-zelandiae]
MQPTRAQPLASNEREKNAVFAQSRWDELLDGVNLTLLIATISNSKCDAFVPFQQSWRGPDLALVWLGAKFPLSFQLVSFLYIGNVKKVTWFEYIVKAMERFLVCAGLNRTQGHEASEWAEEAWLTLMKDPKSLQKTSEGGKEAGADIGAEVTEDFEMQEEPGRLDAVPLAKVLLECDSMDDEGLSDKEGGLSEDEAEQHPHDPMAVESLPTSSLSPQQALYALAWFNTLNEPSLSIWMTSTRIRKLDISKALQSHQNTVYPRMQSFPECFGAVFGLAEGKSRSLRRYQLQEHPRVAIADRRSIQVICHPLSASRKDSKFVDVLPISVSSPASIQLIEKAADSCNLLKHSKSRWVEVLEGVNPVSLMATVSTAKRAAFVCAILKWFGVIYKFRKRRQGSGRGRPLTSSLHPQDNEAPPSGSWVPPQSWDVQFLDKGLLHNLAPGSIGSRNAGPGGKGTMGGGRPLEFAK